jgi:hypothetical protein
MQSRKWWGAMLRLLTFLKILSFDFLSLVHINLSRRRGEEWIIISKVISSSFPLFLESEDLRLITSSSVVLSIKCSFWTHICSTSYTFLHIDNCSALLIEETFLSPVSERTVIEIWRISRHPLFNQWPYFFFNEISSIRLGDRWSTCP